MRKEVRRGEKKRPVLVCLVLVVSFAVSAAELTWQKINREITETFPGAKVITIDDLKTKLKNKAPVVLIDVREKPEYDLSHLQGAVQITRASEIVRRYGSYPGMVVVYCSVGYRSGDMAQQLSQVGMTRVFNLKGSIFRWVNRGNPVVNQHGATTFVHPYNSYWGQLLHKRFHSPK